MNRAWVAVLLVAAAVSSACIVCMESDDADAAADQYLVTFKAGPGGSVNQSSIHAPAGAVVVVSDNTLVLIGAGKVIATASEGYAFTGWNYPDGFITIESDIEFMASFAHKSAQTYTYTLSYDLNGGSGDFPTQIYTGSEASHTFIVPSETPSGPVGRSLFLDWTGYGGNIYHPGGTITLTSERPTETLVAMYLSDYYEVKISAGTGGSVDKTSIASVAYGSVVTADGNRLTVGTRTVTATPSEGYAFDSWSKTSGTITGPTTITASFVKIYERNTVLGFQLDGGTWVPGDFQGRVVTTVTDPNAPKKLIDYTIPSVIPTKEGYRFLGWEPVNGITGSTGGYYLPGAKVYVMEGGLGVLGAVWEIVRHTVTFSAGEGGNINPSEVTVPQGSSIYASGNVLTVGTRTVTATPYNGYAFDSWSVASGTVAGPMAITASFVKLYTHTATLAFDANGGSGAPSSVSISRSTTSPDPVGSADIAVPSAVPTFEGHAFAGWATSASGLVTVRPGDVFAVALGDSVTLYAVWDVLPLIEYRLSFDANGGSGAPADLSASTYESVHVFDIPTLVPVLQGSTFLGWSPSQSSTSPEYPAGGTVTLQAASSELRLYAIWSVPGNVFTVAFDANGGDTRLPPMVWQGQATSHAFTIPDDLPLRSGYVFAGWEAVYGGTASGAVYSPGAQIVLSMELPSVVLSARWDAATYGDPFTIYARDSGWEYDGRIYAYDQVSLYYSAVETIHIGGREYSSGHLYLQLGDRGTVLDLGASGPDFDIVLDGTWAVSAAFYSGESASVTETELSPWGWGWSMTLVGLAFLGFLAVATVLANHLNAGGLRPMDWLIIGISGIVAILMVAGTA